MRAGPLGPRLERRNLIVGAVGVLGRVEAASGIGHVSEHVIEDVARHAREELLSAQLERLQVGKGQLRLVVEHLLVVRLMPAFIHRVAMEAAADPVVDAAPGHGAQRKEDHLQRFPVAGAGMFAQQKNEDAGLRELGGAAETAES